MKNIKRTLIFILTILSVFCILGVTSCTKLKNLYIRRTCNGIDTKTNTRMTKNMSYKLSNNMSVYLSDTTETDESEDVPLTKYDITIYTRNYSLKDSDQLSKDLFGIGLGAFTDNRYNAGTAVVYASTEESMQTPNLVTRVKYDNCNIDTTKIGEAQDLFISTTVLKHEGDGAYEVDNTYPEKITIVSLTIWDSEAPHSLEGLSKTETQEDFIDKVLSVGDNEKDTEIKASLKQEALKNYIIDTLRSSAFISDNITSNSELEFEVTLLKEYDYTKLSIMSFKDDDFSIPFSYKVTDKCGNSSNNKNGKIILDIAREETDMEIAIRSANTDEKFKDTATAENYILENYIPRYVWNSNYKISISADLLDLDLISNYTVNLGNLGRISYVYLEKAGKDTNYLLELKDKIQKFHYTKTYKNYLIVNSDGVTTYSCSISYDKSAKFSYNYEYSENTSLVWRIRDMIMESQSLEELKNSIKTKLTYYLKDKDNLETYVDMKLDISLGYENGKEAVCYKYEIYSEYHTAIGGSVYIDIENNPSYLTDYIDGDSIWINDINL